jgi:hypothetical protein
MLGHCYFEFSALGPYSEAMFDCLLICDMTNPTELSYKLNPHQFHIPLSLVSFSTASISSHKHSPYYLLTSLQFGLKNSAVHIKSIHSHISYNPVANTDQSNLPDILVSHTYSYLILTQEAMHYQ